MVIEACRAVLTERCRLMCKQRGRQHRQELEQGRHAQRPEFHFAHLLRDRDGPHVGRARGAVSGEGPADQN